MEAARVYLAGVLEMAPLAVQLVLEAVDAGYELPLEDALLLEANHFGLASATADMREGTAAFLAKRKAVFTGR
jgi:enoyl-CoA hydratase